MGTNYYAIPKVSDEDSKRFKELASKEDWDTLKRELSSTEEIHIGKSSSGWCFTFDHNNWDYFDKTAESVKSFINDSLIRDEYDRHITIDDFWKMVEAKKGGLNAKTYYEKFPADRSPYSDGLDIHIGELVFSTTTNFS